ncbi:MAG: hypothetical protein HY541_01620 [Deltaproteobacteria bacterium]|nr:hypothetical protein [Deltaproteobacteria bacterium]
MHDITKDQRLALKDISNAAQNLDGIIQAVVPPGAKKEIALTCLYCAVQMANEGIKGLMEKIGSRLKVIREGSHNNLQVP